MACSSRERRLWAAMTRLGLLASVTLCDSVSHNQLLFPLTPCYITAMRPLYFPFLLIPKHFHPHSNPFALHHALICPGWMP